MRDVESLAHGPLFVSTKVQGYIVADDEAALREGIFCEPASAASFAGLVKMIRGGLNLAEQRVVCIFTGNGLKDPDLAVSSVAAQTTEVEPTIEALESMAMISTN